MTCKNDNWDIWIRKVSGRADETHKLRAVNHRHVPIDDYKIGLVFFDGVEASRSISSLVDCNDTYDGQHCPHEFAHRLVILDNQNFQTRNFRVEIMARQ